MTDELEPTTGVSVPELSAGELGPDELRQALGCFVTGVTIVTCRDEHEIGRAHV